jgi:hypothetical protein
MDEARKTNMARGQRSFAPCSPATSSTSDAARTWSPVSYDIGALVAALPDAEAIEAQLQDHGYDHALTLRRMTRWKRFPY